MIDSSLDKRDEELVATARDVLVRNYALGRHYVGAALRAAQRILHSSGMAFPQTIYATAAVAALCGLGGAASAAVTAMPVPSATVVLSTDSAGARPVATTVRL